MQSYLVLLLVMLLLNPVSATSLEFIGQIPETLGVSGIVIIILGVLILVIFFLIYRFLRKRKAGTKTEENRPELADRLVRLKKKLESLKSKKNEDRSLFVQ